MLPRNKLAPGYSFSAYQKFEAFFVLPNIMAECLQYFSLIIENVILELLQSDLIFLTQCQQGVLIEQFLEKCLLTRPMPELRKPMVIIPVEIIYRNRRKCCSGGWLLLFHKTQI